MDLKFPGNWEFWRKEKNSTPRSVSLSRVRFHEYLREDELLSKISIACLSGAQMASIHEIKKCKKISWHCPFKYLQFSLRLSYGLPGVLYPAEINSLVWLEETDFTTMDFHDFDLNSIDFFKGSVSRNCKHFFINQPNFGPDHLFIHQGGWLGLNNGQNSLDTVPLIIPHRTCTTVNEQPRGISDFCFFSSTGYRYD